MDLIVTEGIEGHWFYHISNKEKYTRSLCGKQTMITWLPIQSWGITTHLKERYCEKCKKLSQELP